MRSAYLTTFSISEFNLTQESLENLCTERSDVSNAYSNLRPVIRERLLLSNEIQNRFKEMGLKFGGDKISQAFSTHSMTLASKVEKTLQPFVTLPDSEVVSACKNWEAALGNSESQITKKFIEQTDFLISNREAILNAIDDRTNW